VFEEFVNKYPTSPPAHEAQARADDLKKSDDGPRRLDSKHGHPRQQRGLQHRHKAHEAGERSAVAEHEVAGPI
jgi:hypothetical protein